MGFNRDSEGEGADRTFSLPVGQDELIREMASLNKNVIVAVTSGGAVEMSTWIERIPAVFELWYPGEQGGRALAEAVFGDVNPSGHLPITFEKKEDDNPSFPNYYPEPNTNRIVYKESIFSGYRGYEHSGTKPLFAFGFGLSYTTFSLTNLNITDTSTPTSDKYLVAFDITDTGKRSGAEVGQVYIASEDSAVPRAPKELKGFAKVSLKPGETRHVSVPLDTRSFAYYDSKNGVWRAPAGTYKSWVANRQIRLNSRATLSCHEP